MANMTDYVTHGAIRIAKDLHGLVRDEIAPGTGIDPEKVWSLLDAIVQELGPRNRALLGSATRSRRASTAGSASVAASRSILASRARSLPRSATSSPTGPAFKVTTANVDPEIGTLAGPQLVVPVDNPRYALNAANARWGSLYDALYGTNVIGEGGGADRGKSYNPVRGERVIEYASRFLDDTVPLATGSWSDLTSLALENGALVVTREGDLTTELRDATQFAGYRMEGARPSNVLLRHNGLHIDILIDANDPIGKRHPAGVKDVVLESAVSTIMDCEDSVAAVDAADKVVVYRNWAGIMRGTLTASFRKGGSMLNRHLNADREYTAPDGKPLSLPGRSLLLVRHVGAHMLTDTVTDSAGEPTPETFLDCVITTLGALHDVKRTGKLRNSRTGSVYIVKPKQHGPEEVALSVDLFAAVERGLGLPANTLKIGIMDEERRTTVNLKECIRAARERIIFINTGFLDRTGDELHTHMQAGAVIPKPEIKGARWIAAYEDWNVQVGLELGSARTRADRQGHVGDAGRDACDGRREGRAPESRRELRLGTVADGRDAARDSLPPGRRRGAAARARRPRRDRRAAAGDPHSADAEPRAQARRDPARARQQRAGDLRLRRALGRARRRLLEGARHQRRRPDGGPRDAADLVAAHRELAASRHRRSAPSRRDAAANGEGRRSAERRRSGLSEHGARFRAQHRVPGRARPRVQRPRGTERLYGAHARAPPARVQGEELTEAVSGAGPGSVVG